MRRILMRGRHFRVLGRVAVATALTGSVLAAPPVPIPPPVFPLPGAEFGPLFGPTPVVPVPPLSFDPLGSRPVDRCLVTAPELDSRFVVAASEVDPAMIVPPRVVGLPISPRDGLTTMVRPPRIRVNPWGRGR